MEDFTIRMQLSDFVSAAAALKKWLEFFPHFKSIRKSLKQILMVIKSGKTSKLWLRC